LSALNGDRRSSRGIRSKLVAIGALSVVGVAVAAVSIRPTAQDPNLDVVGEQAVPSSTAPSATTSVVTATPPTPAELVVVAPQVGEGGEAANEPSRFGGNYDNNLHLIRSQVVRNRNLDSSPHRGTPSAELVPEEHYGPRSDYLNNPGFNPEQSFPVAEGGQFRAGCEFSHFSYDDPLVFPGRPGAAHLHMFFGNTDVNAYSTADSVLNSGSSTCNGQELNRTAYWAPAMFDGSGNVRIPERVVVYYKGEGQARGEAEPFPPGAAMIAHNLNTVDTSKGGAEGKFNFVCSDNFSAATDGLQSNTIPVCNGSKYRDLYGVDENPHVVLEMNVKFPQCWNGNDPGNPVNFHEPAVGSWYFSDCGGNHTLVNLEYFINYPLTPDETTDGWYLSSDVDPASRTVTGPSGGSLHADWWGGWNTEINQMFLDNCVNHVEDKPSGCGFGYLTNGGPNGEVPKGGPALKYREQFVGPLTVAASDLYEQLCPQGPPLDTDQVAAYCMPG